MEDPKPRAAGGMTPEEMAIGLAGLAPAPVVLQTPAWSEVRYLTERKRVERYELVFPFAIGDLEIRAVIVKRLTAGEVDAFRQTLRGLAEGDPDPRFPMFFVPTGDELVAISDAAWDALDDDDRFALTEIQSNFLPARFRPPTVAPAP